MANHLVVNMAEKCYLWSMDLKALYQSPIYKSWSNMKTRCTNPKYNQYHRYGGRNISYCDKWHTFKGFYEDMGASYVEGCQLDRIDNDANYSKDNCKWSTPIEQANNRHTNKFITYQGKTQTIEQWARELGLKSSTVRQRYYVYKMPIERCFSTAKLTKIKNV